MTTFTPTDTPTWNVPSKVASNAESINNTWGYTENNAQRHTLSAGTNADNYFRVNTTGNSEQTLTIKVWVKLGTSTNFNLVINNTLASNTIGGQSFTTSTLNTSTYTQISYSFTSPASNAINVHVGANPETGIPVQTAGTVFTYGWQIFVKGKKSVLETDLAVNGNITTGDVFYGPSTLSLTNALSNINTLLPTYATTVAMNNQSTTLLNVIGQKISNTDPMFVGNLSGNDGFRLGSSNNMSLSGQITAKTPVCIAFFGTPTCYNAAGTLQASGALSNGQIYNVAWSSYTNQNWSLNRTQFSKVQIPYTGLYSLQFTFSSGAAASFFQFITKNLGNGQEVSSWNNDDNVLASACPTLAASYTNSISATAYLKTTDVICFSIYPLSGSITYYTRCNAHLTLIQRTA